MVRINNTSYVESGKNRRRKEQVKAYRTWRNKESRSQEQKES